MAALVRSSLAGDRVFRLDEYCAKKPPCRHLCRIVPPHVRARRALEKALSLISEPKPFTTLVSDTLRTYLEERFNFRARTHDRRVPLRIAKHEPFNFGTEGEPGRFPFAVRFGQVRQIRTDRKRNCASCTKRQCGWSMKRSRVKYSNRAAASQVHRPSQLDQSADRNDLSPIHSLLLLLLLLPCLAWLKGRHGQGSAFLYSSVDLVRPVSGLSRSKAGQYSAEACDGWRLALFIVALAQPRFIKGETEIKASGIDIVARAGSFGQHGVGGFW